MATKEYAKHFYKSKEWLKCRQGYISHRQAIDGGLCERCKDELGFIVHHKIYLTPENINDPNTTLNWDNLEYICQDCHNKEHLEKQLGLRYTFGPDGQIVPLPP